MKTRTKAVLVALVLGSGLAASGAWYWMGRALYQPGMVRAGEGLCAPLGPPAQESSASRWKVEQDVELYYLEIGSRNPEKARTIFFVHGGPGIPFAEVPAVFGDLAEHDQYFFYHQRGCGRSTRPFERLTGSSFYANLTALEQKLGLGAQIADIERIRRILGTDQLVLMGHSFGAFLATLYAAEFPEHVAALVLVSPADLLVLPSPREDLFAAMRRNLPAEMREDYDDFHRRYLDFADLSSCSEAELIARQREFAAYYGRAAVARGMQGPPVSEGMMGGFQPFACYLSMGRRHDYSAAVNALAVPTLVLHGERDLQGVAASDSYVGLVDGAELQVLPKSGHFPFFDQPAAFAAAVTGFLERALPHLDS